MLGVSHSRGKLATVDCSGQQSVTYSVHCASHRHTMHSTSSAGVIAKSLKRYHWNLAGICRGTAGPAIRYGYLACRGRKRDGTCFLVW